MNRKGSLKNLVRNLRNKKNEKIIHIGNSAAFSKRKESTKGSVRQEKDADSR